MQRSPKRCAYSGSHASVPARKRLTPPSISPMFGGGGLLALELDGIRGEGRGEVVRERTRRRPRPLTSTTARQIARIFASWPSGCGDFSAPWRATVWRPRRVPSTSRSLGSSRMLRGGGSKHCGGCGIRTHGTLLPTGFQDQVHRPLGQPSRRMRSIRRTGVESSRRLFTYSSRSAWAGAVPRRGGAARPSGRSERADAATPPSCTDVGDLARRHPALPADPAPSRPRGRRCAVPTEHADVVAAVADHEHAARRSMPSHSRTQLERGALVDALRRDVEPRRPADRVRHLVEADVVRRARRSPPRRVAGRDHDDAEDRNARLSSSKGTRGRHPRGSSRRDARCTGASPSASSTMYFACGQVLAQQR